jgi:hypothetical protein
MAAGADQGPSRQVGEPCRGRTCASPGTGQARFVPVPDGSKCAQRPGLKGILRDD